MILDEGLGCYSYNLSGSMMTLDNKYYMLKKELERNPVDTVILEISFDTLTRKEKEEFAIGDAVAITRLDTWSERVAYMLSYVAVDDWLNTYARLFVEGMAYFSNILQGSSGSCVDYSLKGFGPGEPADITHTQSQIATSYNSGSVSNDYNEENVEKFSSIIDLCEDYGARVIVVTVPVSNALIMKNDGWDDFYQWTTDYCRERNCEFYDMNLIANRYDVFQDAFSFRDIDHLSGEGASACTAVLCDLIKKVDAGEDVSELFYQSYAEMKHDSPYMQYIS